MRSPLSSLVPCPLSLALVALLALAAAPAAAATPAGDSDDPKAEAGRASTASLSRPAPRPAHENPRLKLSYRGWSIGNLDGTQVPLKGGQLDVYPLSRRYVRLGIELEGGGGDASLAGAAASLWYGMVGLGAGFQYPARVTPFVEGRFAAGLLGGHYHGTVAAAGASMAVDTTAATPMYVGGIDAGIELYTVGRLYLSAAVGWAHPVYAAPDLTAMQQNPGGGIQLRQLPADTFTFKLGIGI